MWRPSSDDEQLQNDKQEVEDTSTLKTTPEDADTHLGDQHVGETTTPADSGADHDEQQVVETTTLATIGHVLVQPPGKEAAGDEKRRKYPITTRPHDNHQSRTLNKTQGKSGDSDNKTLRGNFGEKKLSKIWEKLWPVVHQRIIDRVQSSCDFVEEAMQKK